MKRLDLRPLTVIIGPNNAILAHLSGRPLTLAQSDVDGGVRPTNVHSPFAKLARLVEDHLRAGARTADLLFYLRSRAAPGQTLVVNESEMNLHPEGQAKLLESLAMLANLGVQVLLMTYSPYVMAHLNNLISADQTSPARKKRQAKHLYLRNPAAFLSPDHVGAYEMRPKGWISLVDPDYGIRFDTLSGVSQEQQRQYFAIHQEPKRRRAKASGASKPSRRRR